MAISVKQRAGSGRQRRLPSISSLVILAVLASFAAACRPLVEELVLEIDVDEATRSTSERPDASLEEILAAEARVVDQVRETLGERLRASGIRFETEPLHPGAPGLTLRISKAADRERLNSLLTHTARLEFLLVHESLNHVARPRRGHPAGSGIIKGRGKLLRKRFVVDPEPIVTTADVEAARVVRDENGWQVLVVTLSSEAGERLGEFTSAHVGEELAVTVAGEAAMLLKIEDAIHREVVLDIGTSGSEVEALALMLPLGPLAAPVSVAR